MGLPVMRCLLWCYRLAVSIRWVRRTRPSTIRGGLDAAESAFMVLANHIADILLRALHRPVRAHGALDHR